MEDNRKIENSQAEKSKWSKDSNQNSSDAASINKQTSPSKSLIDIVTHQTTEEEVEKAKDDLVYVDDEENSSIPFQQIAKNADISPKAVAKGGKKIPYLEDYSPSVRSQIVTWQKPGELVFAKAKLLNVTTHVVAEAKALLEGVEYCVNQGKIQVMLETDSLMMKKVVEGDWEDYEHWQCMYTERGTILLYIDRNPMCPIWKSINN
ncbi:hypothetical protein K7X08_028272 [Anisodus acutangulus]|uniref:RNase H type-1 domain-containing protein n=1 Tax=Anisodus acutangulus TaxID=402998 RepID=A0A9Q1RDR3_9SOLA|nr:hypothetical protein K7X08_028272 [Anisodus acutangulus]